MLIKRYIYCPKYILIKTKKNLAYWTVWFFSSEHITKKKLKIFSIIITKKALVVYIKKQTLFCFKTYLTILENIFYGLIKKYSIDLELYGVGYSIELQSNFLILNLGFSHKIFYRVPSFFKLYIAKKKIQIEGYNLQKVRQFVFLLRGFKFPDSYKGKGIRFMLEKISLKETKKAK